MFRDRTNSEALSTFTCASCAESVPLCSHCSVDIDDPKFGLKHPDLASDETNLLDIIIVACGWTRTVFRRQLPSMTDLLLDPPGVSFPNDGRHADLSVCKTCYSDLKWKRMAATY